MSESFDEGSVFARHDRVDGAVLIIGVGTVGSSLAMQLARLGVNLRLIDKDILERHNIVRHQLGDPWLGEPKVALANKIMLDMPWVQAEGVSADFTKLPPDKQRRYLDEADIVVAATDETPVQRYINRVCVRTQKTVVFPGVWVGGHAGEAEAGEVLWVDPRRRMPCYECVTAFRQEAQDAQAGRAAQADIDAIVLAAVMVVRGLLQPRTVHAQILQPERENLILVHGFMPASREAGEVFAGRALLHVEVPFPHRRCPSCGRQAQPDTAPVGRAAATAVFEEPSGWSEGHRSVLRLLANLIIDTVIVAVWPFILLYPVAVVAAFGPDGQQFLGPVHENLGKTEPGFVVASIVMLACAAFVNLRRFAYGSSARALRGWELIPPVCFVLGIPAVFIFIVFLAPVTHLLLLLFSIHFTLNMPFSALMIWGAALTPPTVLLIIEIIGVHRFSRHGVGSSAWIAGAATMAVFTLLSFFS